MPNNKQEVEYIDIGTNEYSIAIIQYLKLCMNIKKTQHNFKNTFMHVKFLQDLFIIRMWVVFKTVFSILSFSQSKYELFK